VAAAAGPRIVTDEAGWRPAAGVGLRSRRCSRS